jgi:hypothetical protein
MFLRAVRAPLIQVPLSLQLLKQLTEMDVSHSDPCSSVRTVSVEVRIGPVPHAHPVPSPRLQTLVCCCWRDEAAVCVADAGVACWNDAIWCLFRGLGFFT